MVGTVQEVGISEGDVASAQVHELGDVGHDDVLADQTGAPVVHDGDRTMAAAVHASVAGLHVSGQAAFATEGQARVTVQAGKEMADGQPEPTPPQLDDGVRSHTVPVPWSGSGVSGGGEGVDPGDQTGLVLAGDGEIRHWRVPLGPVEACVQAVEAQRHIGPMDPDVPAYHTCQTHSGVHGHRARHRVGP